MDCNDHHLSMETTPWSTSHNMDGLNNALDHITILTDADLQNELDLYATTQFTFDGLPTMPIKDKPTMTDHFNTNPSVYSSHRPPNLVINTMNNNNNDPCPSPYDPQQHYFTPISSLPTSPTLHDLGDHQQMNNPLLSLMLSPTSHQHHQNLMQGPDAQYMNRSTSIDNAMTLNDSIIPTIPKHRPATRRRNGGGGAPATRGRPRRQQRQQQQQQQQQDPSSLLITSESQHTQADDHDNSSLGGVPTDSVHNNGVDDVAPVRLSKRQRNTAASARFRIKKKIREQCLQRTACEMTNKANFMENKVHELEREIKWLKALLVAKNGCGYC